MVITESEQRAPNMRCRQSKQRASHILQDWEFALSLFPLSFFLLFLKERVAHIALHLKSDESKIIESLFLLFEHKIDSLFMRVWFALVKRKLDVRTSFLFKKGNRFLIKGKSLLGNLFHTFWLCFYKKQNRVNLSSSIFSLFWKYGRALVTQLKRANHSFTLSLSKISDLHKNQRVNSQPWHFVQPCSALSST